MAHCSSCLIPWTEFGGLYLMEIHRILRPGGFWVLSGPPVNYENRWRGWNTTFEEQKSCYEKLQELVTPMCFKLFSKKGDIAVWLKALDNSCYNDKLVTADAYPPKCDTMYGGFAAQLIEDPVWVMNVVSSYGANTLPVVYDRGLIGSYHDWGSQVFICLDLSCALVLLQRGHSNLPSRASYSPMKGYCHKVMHYGHYSTTCLLFHSQFLSFCCRTIVLLTYYVHGKMEGYL